MTVELKNSFNNLTSDDKIAFLQAIMPDICDLFRQDPQRMMMEMMPLCRQMLEGVDMQQMMSLMQMMKQNPST